MHHYAVLQRQIRKVRIKIVTTGNNKGWPRHMQGRIDSRSLRRLRMQHAIAKNTFFCCNLPKKHVTHDPLRPLQRGGCTQFSHDRSLMSIDPRIPTMSGRSTSGFHQPGRHCLHQARSAVRCSASRIHSRTTRETESGTLCLLSRLWMQRQ